MLISLWLCLWQWQKKTIQNQYLNMKNVGIQASMGTWSKTLIFKAIHFSYSWSEKFQVTEDNCSKWTSKHAWIFLWFHSFLATGCCQQLMVVASRKKQIWSMTPFPKEPKYVLCEIFMLCPAEKNASSVLGLNFF